MAFGVLDYWSSAFVICWPIISEIDHGSRALWGCKRAGDSPHIVIAPSSTHLSTTINEQSIRTKLHSYPLGKLSNCNMAHLNKIISWVVHDFKWSNNYQRMNTLSCHRFQAESTGVV
jgi:hypothetical protein